jgi:type I restriction enzyme S subunit
VSIPLRRVATIEGGGTPTPDAENWGGPVPFVTPPDLRPVVGGIVEHTARSLSEVGARKHSNIVPAHSVILSVRAPIGYAARTIGPVALNQGCRALTGLDETRARFLTYALQAASNELLALGRGTTFQEISAGQLGTLVVPNPPKTRQRAIADYLDHETAQIDALIAEQQRLVALQSERRKAVLDRLSTGTVGPVIRLKYLFRRVSESNHPKEQVLSVYRDFGVVPKASRDDNFNQTPENVSRYLLVRPGDLVVNRMKAWQGSLGVSEHRGIVSGDYEVATPHTEAILPRFAHLYLRSPKMIAEYAVRSTGIRPSQWRLYWDEMGSIEMPVPALHDQTRLVAGIESALAKLDAVVREAHRLSLLAQERRAALIAAAVTGQIDVGSAA